MKKDKKSKSHIFKESYIIKYDYFDNITNFWVFGTKKEVFVNLDENIIEKDNHELAEKIFLESMKKESHINNITIRSVTYV